jgi:hypothetical protein
MSKATAAKDDLKVPVVGRACPARGALAGAKGDLVRAKQDGEAAYDPRGAGVNGVLRGVRYLYRGRHPYLPDEGLI